MRMAVAGGILLLAGALAIALGLAPATAAMDQWQRVWPVLVFVAAITVVAELASMAGVFDRAADAAVHLARGRAGLLWLLVVLLATLSTVFLSLDTTAVLLTPVVVIVARRARLSPLPFALTTVWLANTGSLLLPVSNLTNLLARSAADTPLGVAEFVALTWLPALACILVPVAVLGLVFRRSLGMRFRAEPAPAIADRVLLVCSTVVVLLLLPALVSGIPVWLSASSAAVLLCLLCLWRRREALRLRLVPFSLVLLAAGLFLAAAVAHALGLGQLLASVVGHGEDAGGLFRLAGAGAAGANLVDNLPAYLAFEPTASSPVRLVALLIGVNAGALILPWASLATLLWHRRLRALDVAISWRRYALLGAVAAPLTVLAGVGALLVTAGRAG